MSRTRNISRLLPDTTGKLANSNMCSGSVVQTVSFTTSTTYSTSIKDYVATGLAVTITPTNINNKILVDFAACIEAVSTGNSNCFVASGLFKNGLRILDLFAQSGNFGSVDFRAPSVGSILDSPNTISPVTYTVYINSTYANTAYLNNGGQSTITAKEIIS